MFTNLTSMLNPVSVVFLNYFYQKRIYIIGASKFVNFLDCGKRLSLSSLSYSRRELLSHFAPLPQFANFRNVCAYINDRLTADFGGVKTEHDPVKRRSTTTNLLDFTSFLVKYINYRQEVHIICANFSKTSNCLNHTILLHKLASINISLSLSSGLSNRPCNVSFYCCISC